MALMVRNRRLQILRGIVAVALHQPYPVVPAAPERLLDGAVFGGLLQERGVTTRRSNCGGWTPGRARWWPRCRVRTWAPCGDATRRQCGRGSIGLRSAPVRPTSGRSPSRSRHVLAAARLAHRICSSGALNTTSQLPHWIVPAEVPCMICSG